MDWSDAYAVGAHIEGAEAFPPSWEEKASAFRAAHGARARLDVAYGDHPRERLDLFLPDQRARGLAVFVHGGYWKAFGKDSWSHLAGGALARGLAVCLPQYVLCPEARISAITRQIGVAIEKAAEEVDGPIWLAGHSAGGHLVTRMACVDGPLSTATRERLRTVLSISGLHDLRPLLRTESNRELRLDEVEARAESPALGEPIKGTDLLAWVGVDERPEFVRQNALLANIWSGFDVRTRRVEQPDKHHFDVIEGLEDAGSDMIRAWLEE